MWYRSNRYYELALKQNPDDFEAAYRLGLNHYVELKSDNIEEAKKNREMGLAYLERAASTPGAPERVRSLVASISSRLGKHELSLQYLVDLYLQTEDVEQRQSLLNRINALKKSLTNSNLADEAFPVPGGLARKFSLSFGYFVRHSRRAEPRRATDRSWRALTSDMESNNEAQ